MSIWKSHVQFLLHEVNTRSYCTVDVLYRVDLAYFRLLPCEEQDSSISEPLVTVRSWPGLFSAVKHWRSSSSSCSRSLPESLEGAAHTTLQARRPLLLSYAMRLLTLRMLQSHCHLFPLSSTSASMLRRERYVKGWRLVNMLKLRSRTLERDTLWTDSNKIKEKYEKRHCVLNCCMVFWAWLIRTAWHHSVNCCAGEHFVAVGFRIKAHPELG